MVLKITAHLQSIHITNYFYSGSIYFFRISDIALGESVVLQIKPGASYMLGRHSTNKLRPQSVPDPRFVVGVEGQSLSKAALKL